jgi:hypothetical protein
MNTRAVTMAFAGLTAGVMLLGSGISLSFDNAAASAVPFRPVEAIRLYKKSQTPFAKKERRTKVQQEVSAEVTPPTKSVACETMTDVYGEVSAAMTSLQITDAEGNVTNPAAPLKTVLDDLLAKYCQKVLQK